MLLKIRHALIEITNAPGSKQSAVIINNEIVLSSGSILQPFIYPVHSTASCPSTQLDISNPCLNIINQLQSCKIVNVQDEFADYLCNLNFRVTFDHREKRTQESPKHSSPILRSLIAHPQHVFCAAEVSRNLHKILLAAESPHNALLRSSFVILSLHPSREKEDFKRFLQHIATYLRYLQPLQTLDDVLVMCSPFGLENFYKTISIGKVSNILGRDSSLFALSNALPIGCEGSAVFNNKLRLIGIIISTSFQRQQENVNLTLAASFDYLLRNFMEQLSIPIRIVNLPREPSKFCWERSIVAIEASGNQGTGTFIRVLNKRFILTCAHVVGQLNTTVFCRAIDREFSTDVLWCNPEENRPYDLTLLAAPVDIPDNNFVRLSRTRATLGQTVYNAGFPYFVNFQFKFDFNPSIFEGRIIKCDNGAIMSDGSVQAGQSGGPMFDQNGHILGVCVSNLKLEDVIYPNINTAIPICDIRYTLQEFARTNDSKVLNNLVANQKVRSVWSLEMPAAIQSKL